MKLHSIHGGSEKDLTQKKYNIGVGVSLGNRWFTIENTLALIKWSLLYTRESVIVYVADSIHAINLEVRSDRSYEAALRKTMKQGKDLLSQIRVEIDETFPSEDSSRIFYSQWGEIEDEKFKTKVKIVYDFYENNRVFKNIIHTIVQEYVSKENRKFDKKDIDRLGMYCVEELPEMVNRVNIGGRFCDACAYPNVSKLNILVEDIQRGLRFPELKKLIMDTEPKVFLEVR